MRILVAPDRFGSELTAAACAAAVAEGWRASAPADDLAVHPLSDGGPGFLDVLLAGRAEPGVAGRLHRLVVRGPLGDPVPARVLTIDGTAYVEAAEAVGLHLVAPEHRDPAAASSYGVGELVAAAAGTGARRLVVGVGGTATTDGGRGLLEALGGPDRGRRRLEGVQLVAATATDAPLMGHSGAALGFAAGKGADRATRDALETALREWATATDGGLAVRPGAGAGGGIGFALLLLGAERVNGTALVVELTRLADAVQPADLVLTGQAVFDWEALRGRVVVAVAREAQRFGRPTVVLSGRVDVGRRELSSAGIDAAYALADQPPGDRGRDLAGQLSVLTARVARTWSH